MRWNSAGKPVGGNDLFIAAHAIALGGTLVTDNEARSPGSTAWKTGYDTRDPLQPGRRATAC